tara:strand:+ start:2607 stop:3041 length:435 start_codon:yes stop_codon:yes gene_type:complete
MLHMNAQAVATEHTVISHPQSLSADINQPISDEEQALALLLPLHSSMTVGMPERGVLDMPILPKPFFIVGADSTSQRWLRKNREKLEKIGAIGFVTNIDTFEQYQALKVIAESIQLIPFQVNILSKRLPNKHYPVIVDAKEVYS